MNLSEVRIKLVAPNGERLLAFCSIVIDNELCIRDLKLIDGIKGVFCAMPSRKLTDRCGCCGTKNHLRAKFCNNCAQRLNENRANRDRDGHFKLHADIAHPIRPETRTLLTASIVQAYEREVERSKQPGYVCTYEESQHGEPDVDQAPSYGKDLSVEDRHG